MGGSVIGQVPNLMAGKKPTLPGGKPMPIAKSAPVAKAPPAPRAGPAPVPPRGLQPPRMPSPPTPVTPPKPPTPGLPYGGPITVPGLNIPRPDLGPGVVLGGGPAPIQGMPTPGMPGGKSGPIFGPEPLPVIGPGGPPGLAPNPEPLPIIGNGTQPPATRFPGQQQPITQGTGQLPPGFGQLSPIDRSQIGPGQMVGGPAGRPIYGPAPQPPVQDNGPDFETYATKTIGTDQYGNQLYDQWKTQNPGQDIFSLYNQWKSMYPNARELPPGVEITTAGGASQPMPQFGQALGTTSPALNTIGKF